MLASTRPVSIRSVPNPSTMPNLVAASSYICTVAYRRTANHIIAVPYPTSQMTTVPVPTPHAQPPSSDEQPMAIILRHKGPSLMQSLDIQGFSYEERLGLL